MKRKPGYFAGTLAMTGAVRRLGCLGTACLAMTVVAGEPLARFSAVEWLEIDWPKTLVTYRVLGAGATEGETDPDVAAAVRLARPVKVGEARLVDAEGNEVLCQWSRVTEDEDGNIASAWLSFFAELPAKGRYDYFLVPGNVTLSSEVSVTEENGRMILDNGLTAARLASMLHTSGDVCNIGDVPGPLNGVRLLDGTWTEPSYFMADDPESAPKVVKVSKTDVADGPIFSEHQVRYDFEGGEWYTATIRLVAGEAFVRIDERMDMKVIGHDRNWRVVFPLTDGGGAFRPDVAWWGTSEGRLGGADEAFEADALSLGFAPLWTDWAGRRPHFGSKTFAVTTERETIFPVAAWYPWWPNAFYFGLAERSAVRAAATEKARHCEEHICDEATQIKFVGIAPMHTGAWRGIPETENGHLIGWPDGRLAMSWPLVVSPHPNTLVHTGEYDPDIPYSTLRRIWAFMAGPMRYQNDLWAFRSYEGYVNLDRYKDWILEWPEDEAVAYPRLTTTPEHVAQVKERLDEHPAAEELKKLLSFNDNEEAAAKAYETLRHADGWAGPRGHALNALARDAQPWNNSWISTYRHAQMAAWANTADEALSSQYLTAEQRTNLRAWIAAVCYAMTEADFNPRGSMVHLGNPGMPILRFFGIPFAATLIPDHPMAKRWMEVSQEYLRFKAAQNIAPGGAYSDQVSYYMAGASHLAQTAMVLDNQGMLDDSAASLIAQMATYPLALMAPKDPRFDNFRVTPQWGHEGYQTIATTWLPTAAFMRRRDPELARALVRAWDELGRPMSDHHDASFSPRTVIHADLLNDPPDEAAWAEQNASQWMPGFGASLRAHVGDPMETHLAFREGYLVSHCDENQGDFVLYSKGGPLTTMGLFMYGIHGDSPFANLKNAFGWHNRVRFGSQGNTGGWPGGGIVSGVHRFASSPSVDYLHGMGDYPPQRWHRQFLFLKGKTGASPNYFVLRDSFRATREDARPPNEKVGGGGPRQPPGGKRG
ncbi:MAG: hypothetical protein FWF84_06845, partial [Kiritimatiellaeota bacterium]|nr:hypothetical protein [Kiritimatiellota bacterium]